jgi:hypothetical protein
MKMSSSTDIGPGTRLLLHLWRGLNKPDYRTEVDGNWESFLAACDYHQVGPIVFHRFQDRLDVPRQIMEQLRAHYYQVAAYNHRLATHLVQLMGEFEQQGMPCMALKGPAAATAAYGDLTLRQYEDIDLLVRMEDVAKAVEMLIALGFQPARGQAERYKHLKLYHEVTLTAPDNSYDVDLHWQLTPPYARVYGPDVHAVWLRAERLKLPQGSVRVLGREDLFLTLCQHGTRHRWWQLKWLFDIAELLRQSATLDWSRIEDVLRARPMARAPASLATLLARELLGIQVAPEVGRILEPSERTRVVGRAIQDELLSRGQTNGSAHDTLLGLEHSSFVRAKYMAIEILFTITEKDLQFVRLPEGLRPLYYFVRPLRLMVQHGRGAARRIWLMAR